MFYDKKFKQLFKLSIITCTYNSEKYLAQSIESVLGQSYKNIEHIFGQTQ